MELSDMTRINTGSTAAALDTLHGARKLPPTQAVEKLSSFQDSLSPEHGKLAEDAKAALCRLVTDLKNRGSATDDVWQRAIETMTSFANNPEWWATMKRVLMQHEITEEIEVRSEVKGLKLIRLKGYNPSWALGETREAPLDHVTEGKLQLTVAKMQSEFDMAWRMPFMTLRLVSAMHGRHITSFREAAAFVEELPVPKQNLPHWQMARQALHNATISAGADDLAWREFRDALVVEGWLTT
jgi:hypothetical protein